MKHTGNTALSSSMVVASFMKRVLISFSFSLRVFAQTVQVDKSSGVATNSCTSTSSSSIGSTTCSHYDALALLISLRRQRGAFVCILLGNRSARSARSARSVSTGFCVIAGRASFASFFPR